MTSATDHNSTPSAPIPLLDMLQLTYTTELRNLEAARSEADAMATSDDTPALSQQDHAQSIVTDVLTRLGARTSAPRSRTAALFEPPKAPTTARASETLGSLKYLQLNAFSKPGHQAVAKDIDRLMTTLSDDGEAVHDRMAFMNWNFDLPKGRTGVKFSDFPQLHTHFMAVNEHWPYWLHFLAPTRENMARLFILMSNGVHQPGENGEPGMQILSEQSLLDGGKRAIRAAVALQAVHDVPTHLCKQHARSVLDAMRRAMTQ